ncbi:NUDIX hydrolase [Moraxella lincolnii]|uniref:NUDIX hydrolase n=1 Tax=Lwoffella lincolnii TaxID=90241 RepID=A0A1T0CI19_9GAMM|nr:NUDIX hydrolase [Moraxella lincolnii]OOS21919.1 NUDIX hydrolase [Moraxella lincolnii]
MSFCQNCGHHAKHQIPQGDNRPRLVCSYCGHIHYDNPKIICGALVVHDDKVLLCQRAIEPQYGLWTLPAGFMEIGETTAQGALRETLEEADAIAINPMLYCLYDIPKIGQVYVLYLAQLQHGQFGVGSESLQCGLFAETDIPWDKLAFEAVRRTLRHYFADRRAYSQQMSSAPPLHHERIDKEMMK